MVSTTVAGEESECSTHDEDDWASWGQLRSLQRCMRQATTEARRAGATCIQTRPGGYGYGYGASRDEETSSESSSESESSDSIASEARPGSACHVLVPLVMLCDAYAALSACGMACRLC